ncbi:MAG: hypothetical protein AAF917_08370 [Pseudomonadota bacterium]
MAWVRYLLYFVFITTVLAVLTRLEVHYPGFLKLQVFVNVTDSLGTSEFSPIEIMQPVILAVSACLMAWVAYFCPSQRPLAFTFGGIAVGVFLREMDYVLDRLLIEKLYQVVIAVIAALLIAYLYRHWKRFQIAVARSWPSPGLTLLFCGSVFLFSLVHLIGHEPLWQAIMGDRYVRAVKIAAEEFLELIGYLFWLVGTIEYVYQAKSIAYQKPQPAARRLRDRRRRGERRYR